MKSEHIVPNHAGTTEEVTKRLEELVAVKLREPNSLLAMLEFKQFMDSLPYGKVSFDALIALCEQVMEKDPMTAVLLLNFATDQELHLQKKPD
mgnify:CR=1 FL=1